MRNERGGKGASLTGSRSVDGFVCDFRLAMIARSQT